VADRSSRRALVNADAYAFARELRDQRERRGVTLQTIAAQTKINVSLLAGLERGDVSAWPTGLFRRAFIRGYAAAIGLSPEPIVEEFARLFPETGVAPDAAAAAPAAPGEPRMTLGLDARALFRSVATRSALVLLEVCAIVAAARAAADWLPGVSASLLCAVIALVYYPLTRLWPSLRNVAAYTAAEWHGRSDSVLPEPAADVREAPTEEAALT
jgi:hypothetical protein